MNQDRNIAWLTMAMEMPFNYINESFFYDRKNSEFFVTTLLDSILINTKLEGTFSTNYTEEETARLTEKLRLINIESKDIVEIPRLTIEERIAIQTQFANQLDTVNSDYLKRIIDRQDGKCKFMLDDVFEANPGFHLLTESWKEHKMEAILNKVFPFATTNEINLQEAKIWHINKSRMIKKATSKTKTIVSEKPKPWWKLG